MNMDTDAFIQAINDEQITKQNQNITQKKFQDNLNSIFQPLIDFVSECLQNGELSQAGWIITGTDIEFRLETNLINLPLRYNKAISKIISGDGEMPINIYMIAESPDLNRSKLRIDELSTADDFIEHSDKMNDKILKWVKDKLDKIYNNQKEAKSTEKASKKKISSKKSKSSKK